MTFIITVSSLSLFFLLICWFQSNCQGLSYSNSCNGSGGQSADYEASVGPEVKLPLDKCAKTNDEYLVTKRRNGGRSCDDDDTGSIEAQYFGNQDSAGSEGVKHGFGNAKRHVLLSLFFSSSCYYFSFFLDYHVNLLV